MEGTTKDKENERKGKNQKEKILIEGKRKFHKEKEFFDSPKSSWHVCKETGDSEICSS